MVLQLFLYSFHTSVSLNNNLTSVYNLQISLFLFFFPLCFSSHVMSYHPICLSLCSPLPLLTLLTSDILSVPLGLTIGNPLCHLPVLNAVFFYRVLCARTATWLHLKGWVNVSQCWTKPSALLTGTSPFDLKHLSLSTCCNFILHLSSILTGGLSEQFLLGCIKNLQQSLMVIYWRISFHFPWQWLM